MNYDGSYILCCHAERVTAIQYACVYGHDMITNVWRDLFFTPSFETSLAF
jgi:hypothetical protein